MDGEQLQVMIPRFPVLWRAGRYSGFMPVPNDCPLPFTSLPFLTLVKSRNTLSLLLDLHYIRTHVTQAPRLDFRTLLLRDG